MKRTELRRVGTLRRTARLERGPQPQRRAAPKPSRRETGFSRTVKLLVRERAGLGEIDDAACEACGKWCGRYLGDIQHRVARGSGGCRDAVVGCASNGALLCRECHRLCEARDTDNARDVDMEYAGFFIRHGNGPEFDPRYVPIMHNVVGGSGTLVWLPETEARYLYAEPKAAA